MQASQLIKDTIPPLRLSDSGERAMLWMDIFHVDMLPVINGKKYLGLITHKQLTDQILSDPISSYKLDYTHPYLLTSQHIYEAFSFAANHNYPVIPVIDEQHHYAGLITYADLIAGLVEIKSLNTEGSIIVISIKQKDYQLSRIMQIIESNDAQVLNTDVFFNAEQEVAEVTIKINRLDLSRIESAFYRHNYVIKSLYHQSQFNDELQNRYDSLMNYLNI